MSKFKVSRPNKPGDTSAAEAEIAQAGADPMPAATGPVRRRRKEKEITKDFGAPLTALERDMLDDCADIADQSARKMARKFLVEGMRAYIAKHGE